jgi:NADH dehydrogenase FAD-containing subunit
MDTPVNQCNARNFRNGKSKVSLLIEHAVVIAGGGPTGMMLAASTSPFCHRSLKACLSTVKNRKEGNLPSLLSV